MGKRDEQPVIVKHVSPLASLWGFIIWLVGIVVFLSVGFGMVGGTLTVPWVSDLAGGAIVVAAGWFVVVLTVLGFVLKLVDLLGW